MQNFTKRYPSDEAVEEADKRAEGRMTVTAGLEPMADAVQGQCNLRDGR